MLHKQEALLLSIERSAWNRNVQHEVCLELSSSLVLQNVNSLSESFGKISWSLLDTIIASFHSFCQTWCMYLAAKGAWLLHPSKISSTVCFVWLVCFWDITNKMSALLHLNVSCLIVCCASSYYYYYHVQIFLLVTAPFAWWMGTTPGKEGWKSWWTDGGALSAMIPGAFKMQEWFVVSWDTIRTLCAVLSWWPKYPTHVMPHHLDRHLRAVSAQSISSSSSIS